MICKHLPLTLDLKELFSFFYAVSDIHLAAGVAETLCTQTGVSTVTDGRTLTEVQGSGMTMMIDGKKDVNLTEMCQRVLIIDMMEMDTAGQREQGEVESIVTHLRACTKRIH